MPTTFDYNYRGFDITSRGFDGPFQVTIGEVTVSSDKLVELIKMLTWLHRQGWRAEG